MLRKATVILFFICLINIPARAEEVNAVTKDEKPAIEKAEPIVEEWDPPSAGPITTWTAPLCEKGELVVQPFFFYNHTRGIFNDEGHYDALPEGSKQYNYQEQLLLEYGLTSKLEIDFQTVYMQNYVKQDEFKAHSNGIGDSYLFLRYNAIEEEGWIPHITPIYQLKAPTGKYKHEDPNQLGTDITGSGSWDNGIGVILTKKLKPFIFHLDAIYSFPQQIKIDGIKTKYADYLNYDFGVEYFLPKGFNLMLEFNGLLQGDQKTDGEMIPGSDVKSLAVCPGIGWSCDKVQTLLAYQRTVLGTNTDANDSVILTAVYTF